MSAASVADDFGENPVAEIDDAIADDFAPVDPSARAGELAVRGYGRRRIAKALGVPLVMVHTLLAEWARERSGESGTRRESLAMTVATLEDIQARAYRALDRDIHPGDTASLLRVVLDVQRLKAQMHAATARSDRAAEQ